MNSRVMRAVAVGAGAALAGCMINVILLEILIREGAGEGISHVMSFAQFAFVAAVGAVQQSRAGRTRHNKAHPETHSPQPQPQGSNIVQPSAAARQPVNQLHQRVRMSSTQPPPPGPPVDQEAPHRPPSRSSSLLLLLRRGPFLPRPVVPLWTYTRMVLLMFFLTFVNTKALEYPVPIGIRVLFRCLPLPASAILSWAALDAPMCLLRIAGILATTVGLFLATLSATPSPTLRDGAGYDSGFETEAYALSAGVVLLAFALFASAALSVAQQRLIEQYGPVHREMQFYVHLLALPIFLPLLPTMFGAFRQLLALPSVYSTGLHVNIPIAVLALTGSILSQWLCIWGVFTLVGTTSALTTTFVVTVRKFLSLHFTARLLQQQAAAAVRGGGYGAYPLFAAGVFLFVLSHTRWFAPRAPIVLYIRDD